MRSVKQETAFKKDLKREMSGKYRDIIEEELPGVVKELTKDIALPSKYKDHALIGNWLGHRDCHIRPDLALIYMKIGETTESDEEKSGELRLVRLGNHSELF